MFTSRHEALLAAAQLRADRPGTRRTQRAEPCATDRPASVDGLLWDGSQIPVRDRGAMALMAFTQGDGFLPGQIIDRCA